MDIIDLRIRYDALMSQRNNVESTYELIEKFVVPYRGKFFTNYNDEGMVEWRKRDLYDDTAVDAAISLASAIHSGLTNSSIVWFALGFSQGALQEDAEAMQWLEMARDKAFWALQESNFNLEIGESYLDIVSFGMSHVTLSIEETDAQGFGRLVFGSVPIVDSVFETDYEGNNLYFYRRLMWTPQQIASKFGENKVPLCIKEKLADSKLADQQIEVVFAIYPRRGLKVDPYAVQGIAVPEQRPFAGVYFLHDAGEQVGDELGYYEMPTFSPRWRGTVQSKFGNSPAMVCLSSILTLNQLVEMTLKAAEKAIDPPILSTRRGVFGDIDLKAGGQTTVASLESLKAFESAARFDVSELQKDNLHKTIRQAFFVDQLQLKESPAMTATEVNARMELINRLMGPSLSRIQYNLLSPIIKRTVTALIRYGVIPTPPKSVLDAGGDIKIEYLGQSARAQSAEEAISIERWLSGMTAMAEAFPDILDNVDSDYAATELGMSLGVPARAIKPKAKIKAIRDKREKIREEQERAAKAAAAAETAAKAGQGLQALQGGAVGGGA